LETFEIIWSSRAVKDLQKVYNFNTTVIGEEKSFEFIQLLIKHVDMLADKRFVEMGVIDEEFKHLKRKYKKLIEGDIKITYRLSTSTPVVYINRIFDTRQNPLKNK
jgi:hypothetical protein